MPIFNNSCNSIGCHSTNSVPPDLSPLNAYTILINSSDLVNITNPEKSEIYLEMTNNQSPMPPSGALPYQASQVLSWITDGAENN